MTLLELNGIYDVKQTEPMSEIQHLQKSYTDFVQRLMDETVQARGYDDVFTCISYVNSTDEQFQKEAQAVLRWRDLVWRKCYNILDDVFRGYKHNENWANVIPSTDELLAELPTLEWGE